MYKDNDAFFVNAPTTSTPTPVAPTVHAPVQELSNTQAETIEILLSVYRDLTGERLDSPEYKEPEHLIMALGISAERGTFIRRIAQLIREAL